MSVVGLSNDLNNSDMRLELKLVTHKLMWLLSCCTCSLTLRLRTSRQAEKLEEKEVEDDDEAQLLGEARTATSKILDMCFRPGHIRW